MFIVPVTDGYAANLFRIYLDNDSDT